MSVRHGKLISKEEKGWHLLQNNRLCVEEPFNTSRNLGNTADDTSFRGLHQELRRAFKAISEGKLDECCEQYEYPPEEERVWERPAPQPRPVLTPMPPANSHSRGGRGGGRGGRNQNHYNRGSHGSRRASSAANRSNMSRHQNAAFAAEIALQAQQAQHAQYLLHDHLYQQIQILQAQEQELRMKQAMISSRSNASLMRPQYIQFPIALQPDSGSPDENSQSRANIMHGQGPLTTSVRQNILFSPSFVPVNVAAPQPQPQPQPQPKQPPPNTTNPPSPSPSNVAPDTRRNHRRSSIANSSPRSSLRAQSQPARPITTCVPNNFSTFYATAMGQPDAQYVQQQSSRPSPDSPQRTPTERDYGFPATGPYFLKTGPVDETGISPEYISYYVGDSPQTQGTLSRRSMASSYPGHPGLAIRSTGMYNIFYTPTEYRPIPMPTFDQSNIPLEQLDSMNAHARLPQQHQYQQTTQPKSQQGHGLLIIDGSVPANDYRRQSTQDEHMEHVFTPQHSSVHSQRTSRQDTPNNGSREPSPTDQSVFDEADSVFNTPHHEAQQHHPQGNGWTQNARTGNKPVINGHHIGRLETLSEQLQRFQLSDPAYLHHLDTSHLAKENGVHTHDNHLVNGNGNGNGNGVHHTPVQSQKQATTSKSTSAKEGGRGTSPTIKRRGNGPGHDTEHHSNGVSQKQKPRWHSVSSIPSMTVSNAAESRDAPKPNGIHTATKPISNGASHEHASTSNNITSGSGGWQTTTTKKKNKKGANRPVAGAEPLPADESLRKGG